MSINFRNNSNLSDYLLKQSSLIFNVTVNSNATPASKILVSDINGVAVLRCEGETAQADAIDSSISWTAASDATGIFGILVTDKASNFLKATVTPSVGTVTVTKGISANGNLYLDCDSNQSFASQSVTFLVELIYKK